MVFVVVFRYLAAILLDEVGKVTMSNPYDRTGTVTQFVAFKDAVLSVLVHGRLLDERMLEQIGEAIKWWLCSRLRGFGRMFDYLFLACAFFSFFL